MIITLLIYIISSLFGMIALMLPAIQLWPDSVLNAISWFFSCIYDLKSIIFFIPQLLAALSFFLTFLTYFILYKLIIKAIGLLRGSSNL